MSTVQSMLLDDIRGSLIKTIKDQIQGCVLSQAFVTWLIRSNPFNLKPEALVNRLLQAERNPRETAALGILGTSVELDAPAKEALLNDLVTLTGREPVVAGTPMPFCTDGMTLGGILLGTKVVESSVLKDNVWVEACRRASSNGRGLGSWQEPFLSIVGEFAGQRWASIVSENEALASIVTVAMHSSGLVATDDLEAIEELEHTALNSIKKGVNDGISCAEAVLRLACIDWVRRTRPVSDLKRISIPDMCNLLNRTSSGLMYWTWEDKGRTSKSEARKWYVDHEYHVQNLLWTMLSPLFPDLVEEDYTVKIGKKQPRADFGIPSLRAIVEAKFWYSKHPSKKMVEEIAEDASLYLVDGSRYDCIIAYIWDEGRRTEEHKTLVDALKSIDGVDDAIIVSKPGFMNPLSKG